MRWNRKRQHVELGGNQNKPAQRQADETGSEPVASAFPFEANFVQCFQVGTLCIEFEPTVNPATAGPQDLQLAASSYQPVRPEERSQSAYNSHNFSERMKSHKGLEPIGGRRGRRWSIFRKLAERALRDA
jgi:hypothetical protein